MYISLRSEMASILAAEISNDTKCLGLDFGVSVSSLPRASVVVQPSLAHLSVSEPPALGLEGCVPEVEAQMGCVAAGLVPAKG